MKKSKPVKKKKKLVLNCNYFEKIQLSSKYLIQIYLKFQTTEKKLLIQKLAQNNNRIYLTIFFMKHSTTH